MIFYILVHIWTWYPQTSYLPLFATSRIILVCFWISCFQIFLAIFWLGSLCLLSLWLCALLTASFGISFELISTLLMASCYQWHSLLLLIKTQYIILAVGQGSLKPKFWIYLVTAQLVVFYQSCTRFLLYHYKRMTELS